MNFDFPLILVMLTLLTGAVWLIDRLFFAPRVTADTIPAEKDLERPYWVEMCRSFFPILAIVLVLRSFLVEPFQIPSGSMLPTLQVGDFILVNKYDYGLRLPVLGTKILDVGQPERGDIMVFKYPLDRQTNYIKRVVGLPGDHIRYQDKQLYINGVRVEREFLAALREEDRYLEQLGEVSHSINLSRASYNPGPEGEWTVPEGNYFMLGDNRDNSKDSRYWNFVPDELIVGRAFAIWAHFPPFPSLPEFDRVGLIH